MNKNVLAVFTAVCGLFMISCDTPSDLRPGTKVSVDTVPPGMRNTYNVSDAEGEQAAGHKEVVPGHDPGVNTIQKGDSIPAAAKTGAEGADKQ
jgi:hypothetical protein